MRKVIYPGHGACESCGAIDPCESCVGTQMPEHTYDKVPKELGNSLRVKLDNSLKEKINSILSSVIQK